MEQQSSRIELADPFDLEGATVEKKVITEAERVARLIEVSDFKWLMAHRQGRRIIWRQLEQHGVYRSSFSNQPLEMAFLEGQRNDGLRLLGEILEHAPDRYAEMLKEQKDDRSRSSARSSSTGSNPGNE